MRKISLTILVIFITLSLSAEKTPGISIADHEEQSYLISYVGAGPIKCKANIDNLSRAEEISER